MRNTPMRWIEQAERRHVIDRVLFEESPEATRSNPLAERARRLLLRLGAALAERQPVGGPLHQLQPAPVRRWVRRR